MQPVRILLVGSDPLARAGLAALVAADDRVTVAGDAGPQEAARAGVELGAAVVVWDLGQAGSAEGLVAAGPPVLALAAGSPDAAEALRAGARGVLLRGADAVAIAAAAVAVSQGLAVLDPGLAGEWLRPPGVAPSEGLTAREGEVLALLAEGLPNKGIAARLGISERTAKFHVNAILAKLGAESRAAAIVKAARLGLVVL